jgi:hypothetical protein
MRRALYARFLFGASAVLYGIIMLMWHDADTWQGLPFLTLPLGAILGACIAIAQIAGGVGITYARTARVGSIVLGIVYVLFCLGCVPGMIAKPTVYGEYVGFFEWLALVFGALAVYAAVEMGASPPAALERAARIGLGICTVSFMLAQIAYLRYTASLVPMWIPPSQMFWTILTTVAFGVAAIAILINVRAQLAMRLMTLMLALFGILVWVPRLLAHPEAHGNWSEFAVNFLITGAVWAVAEVTA